MVKSIGNNKIRTAIFISGNGSNMKNLIKFSEKKNSPIVVDLVLSNNKKANGINYLKRNKIDFKIFNFEQKNKDEKKILDILKKREVHLICLAGFMRVLSGSFIKRFNGKILN